MGVSIEVYRERIGSFARVATVSPSLGSFSRVATVLPSLRGHKRNTCCNPKQSKDFGTVLPVIIRLGCLVVLVAAIIPSFLLVLDLTQFGNVEKNPGPNSANKYTFHRVDPEKFEDLATTVLHEIYKLPFLRFKSGKDGGRDAVAKNPLNNQNLVVQVKHTKHESERFNDARRKNVFDGEKKKVEKLVKENELDIYIIVTNYELPAGQCKKLKKTFTDCGAKEVVVVGNKTLTQWLNDSQELQQKVLRLYPECLSYQTNMDVGMGDDDIKALKEILSDRYKNRESHLHPLPWLHTKQFKLDKFYTKLGIIQRDERSKLTDKIVKLNEIFDKHEYSDNPRTILIEGSPGMGKTTLSLKLAHDWAMEKMPEKFPPIELVFLIKCRDMKCDILKAINDQLVPLDEDDVKKELPQIIKKYQDKILLVVDGLDETPKDAEKHVMNLLKKKLLRKCYVVATSRQEKGLQVREYFDTLLEIKGYSEDDIYLYIERYFVDKLDLAYRLIDNLLEDSPLKTLATNPLNTVLLCVVFEEYQGQLPSTVTELYDKIVLCITKRYRARHASGVEDKDIETYKETLGKLAYKGLLEDSLSFLESDLNVDIIQCTKVGFLYKEVSQRNIEPDHTYWFLHKTFQEYLVAFHFTNTFETADEMVEKLKDTERFMQVLMFVSGMLRKKDVVQCRNFVKKLGTALKQNMDKNKVVGILCAVLSESFVDKDMARIIYQFLPENLSFTTWQNPYVEYLARTMPGILNLLCTEDGLYQEVNFNKLEFEHNKVSTSDLGLICKALKEKLKVRKLTLRYCEINNEGASALADMLSHNTTLKKLKIWRSHLNGEEAKILAKGLSQNTTPRVLDVSCNNLGDGGVKAITTVLTPNTSFKDMAARNSDDGDKEDDKKGLHTLEMVGNECGETGASAVADMLRTNKTLKKLDMGNDSLGSRGVTHLAKALKLNKTLEYFSLIKTGCGNEGAVAIADMLHDNETLTVLHLSNRTDIELHNNNKVGKDGAVALAGALRVNESLKELHLTNNDITDEGLKCLREALLVNTTLKTLCIKYPGSGSRRLENDEPLKKKCRPEGRITWECNCERFPGKYF